MPSSLKIFGTDGVRGVANEEPMTPHSLQRLASAAGGVFNRGDHRHQVVIGKDTRLSGYMVESTLTAGFLAVGVDVTLLGPIPTPAVAMLTRTLRADLGVMISASHNPYEDNGIKFFGPDGHKLSREIEAEIEKKMDKKDQGFVSTRGMGKARRLEDASGRYVEFVKATFPRSIRLDGLRVVVDCAHGAAYKVALPVFWELGADVISIGDQPDGCNINENCGALHIEALRQTVLEEEADIGIALDGDADRLVVIDEKGTVLDGDKIIALIATSWQKSGRLSSSTIVGTVMSNLGLELYLKNLGLTLERTPVGDRHVSSAMCALKSNVGGEQSGHIILKDYATTGDGLIAALQVLEVLVRSGKTMSEVAHVFDTVPQVLKSQRFLKDPLKDEIVLKKIKSVEGKLEGRGRLLVRKSGTEPVIRVMAEGPDQEDIIQEVQEILDIMETQGCLAPQ